MERDKEGELTKSTHPITQHADRCAQGLGTFAHPPCRRCYACLLALAHCVLQCLFALVCARAHSPMILFLFLSCMPQALPSLAIAWSFGSTTCGLAYVCRVWCLCWLFALLCDGVAGGCVRVLPLGVPFSLA